MLVETGLLDDRADARKRRGALVRHRAAEEPHRAVVAWVRPSSILISVVLPAPFGPR